MSEQGEQIEGYYDTSNRRGFRDLESQKRNMRLGLMPCDTNVNLLVNGESNPIYSWRNRATMKYECPREEYVQSLEAVKLKTLSQKWGVPPSTLTLWARKGAWGLERKTFWEGVASKVKDLNQESIAQTRTLEMAERLGMYRAIKQNLMGKMSEGVVREMSAKGYYIERPFNATEYKDIVTSLKLIDAEIDKAMGIATWTSKQGEDSEGAFGISRIGGIVFNFNGPPDTTKPLMIEGEEVVERAAPNTAALPPAEGEVVEPETHE